MRRIALSGVLAVLCGLVVSFGAGRAGAQVVFPYTSPVNIYGTADQTRSVCFYSCALDAQEIHTINVAGLSLWSHNDNQAKFPIFYLMRSNGTQASPTALTYTGYELNSIGGLFYGGWDGTQYVRNNTGGVLCATDENWTSTHHGSHCSMYSILTGHTTANQIAQFGGKDSAGNDGSGNVIIYAGLVWNGNGTSNAGLFCANLTYCQFRNGANSSDIAVTASNLLGSGFLQSGSVTAATAQAGDLVLAKETDAGTAPGAGFCKLKVVAGTTSGTGKLLIYCGTSTTPVTLADNIGSGF